MNKNSNDENLHKQVLELCRKEFNVCIETSKCIKWSQRCDRYVDCPDQSDELYCGMFIGKMRF